jgi:hypothetical protein
MQEIKELEFRLRQEYAPHRGWTIRLIENFLGGISVALFLFSLYVIYDNGYTLENWQLFFFIGIAVFCLVNMIRFLRDEIVSIPYLFYRLGALSKQATIDNLLNENRELLQRLAMQQTDVAVKHEDKTNAVYKAALKMIKLFYSGYEIDRTTCRNHGIREQEWNQARELLVRAGIVNTAKSKRTELISPTYTEAKQKLMEILE